MADSVFSSVEMGLPIEVFQLTKQYNDSNCPDKVNLGAGAYRTEEGKPWVLPVVMAAQMQMASDKTLNYEYLPVSGLPDFRTSASRIVFGSNHRVITDNRVASFQALGGTGSLRLSSSFLKEILHYDTVYVSAPTWGNHKGVFKKAGFTNIKEYRYWDSDARDLNINAMLEDLYAAPQKSVVILHGVAHNPTGMDPSKEQWEMIYKCCKEKNLFVVIDLAYQGFASGDLDEDAWAVRYFADQDIDLFVAQSFSKNFGLYSERVGCLHVVSKDCKALPSVSSQMELVIRAMYSNPSNHGARIVATVLNNKAYYEDWKGQLTSMSGRIKKMRQELVEQLKKLGTPGNWDHITKQIGMFSYTGLTGKQVEYLKSKHIYLLGSGRISLCGVNSKNVSYVAKTIDEAVRSHPLLKLCADAGEPAPGREVISFLELAKRKLQETLDVIIATGVTIDGVMISEDDEDNLDPRFYIKRSESDILDFIKVQLKGSMSETSSPELVASATLQQAVDKVASTSAVADNKPIAGSSRSTLAEIPADSLSMHTLPGTLRSTVKTFSSRGAQTTGMGSDRADPKCIPARFQGTMMTPVYFDGLMMTPDKLESLMKDAMRNDERLAIPVEFSGGMITAAFKALGRKDPSSTGKQEAEGDTATVNMVTDEEIKVKFEGRLQGILDSNICRNGMPVIFEGNMAHR